MQDAALSAFELFLLDENVLIMAMARGRVESPSGRLVRVNDDDRGAFALVNAIVENGHWFAMSAELLEKYQAHRSRLQSAGIGASPSPMDRIWEMILQGRVEILWEPPLALFPDSFPTKDRYLAHLALATGAALVTEDSGVLDAAKDGNLGFEILTIDQALERARERA